MTTTPPTEPAKEFRARSNVPFFIGLAILSGVYVVLIVGMLLAEVLFLFPPNNLVLIVPRGNPHQIEYLEDLQNPNLKVGLGDAKKTKFGKGTEKLLSLSWLTGTIRDPVFSEDAGELVDRVSGGSLDVAIVPQHDLGKANLAFVVAAGNPRKIHGPEELARPELRIGLEQDRGSNLGKRLHQFLSASGLEDRVTPVPNFMPKPQRGELQNLALALIGNSSVLGQAATLPAIATSKRTPPTQQQWIGGVKDGDLDAVVVFADDAKLDFAGVQKIPIEPERIGINAARYPGHLGGWVYPFWWLNIKFWSLLAPLEQQEIRYALWLSLISCSMTTILCLWVAIPFGYLMSRFQFPGKTLVDAILDIPIVLPPLVIGLALLILFGTPLGEWIEAHVMVFRFAVPSVILAQFTVACAFAVRTMRVTFDQISTRQEQVALTLGCSRGQAFWKVVLPESRRGIITAATLAWARSLGEFGPILVFSGATRMRTEVLPTTVYLELNVGNIEAAVAVSLLMVLAAAVVLVIVRLYGMEKAPVQLK
jgi:molybdate transport system permease protein